MKTTLTKFASFEVISDEGELENSRTVNLPEPPKFEGKF